MFLLLILPTFPSIDWFHLTQRDYKLGSLTMFSSRSQTHYSLVVSQTTALIAHLVILKGCEILYVNGCGQDHNDQGQRWPRMEREF